jgi:hypothetical protein
MEFKVTAILVIQFSAVSYYIVPVRVQILI